MDNRLKVGKVFVLRQGAVVSYWQKPLMAMAKKKRIKSDLFMNESMFL